MRNIAVIGLGLMGAGIASHFLKDGYALNVHNRTREKAQSLVDAGARWSATPREAAQGADVVIGVLGDDVASRASWLGPDGAFIGMAPGTVAVECSTLSVEWAKEWIGAANERGVHPVDATLAGSKDAARAGTVRLFVGADDKTYARIAPVLLEFSNDLIHFGPPGSGVLYKLINNMWAAVQLVSLAEGLAIAERGGLNMETVARAVPVGASASGIVKGKLAEILSGDYSDVHFALKWMTKDVTYAVRAADGVGAITPTAAAARELFKMAAQRGLGELDMPAVAEVIRGKQMETITLQKPFEFVRGQAEPPVAVGPDEALIRIRRVGICGTDLHGFRGKQPFFSYPRVLGHELGVEVAATGNAVTGVAVGDHCSVEPYLNCGTCIACRNDKPNCCTSLKVLGVHIDGGMRDEIVVPARKLHVANDLSLDQLALVETLCIGAHAVSRAQIQPDQWVLVIGAGPIGLSVIEYARLATRNVVVLDINEQRLGFCARQYGAHIVRADQEPVQNIEALTNGDLPTVVFDATGSPASMMKSFEYVAHGGKLVFVGLAQADITFNDPFFHRREITLYASRNATPRDFDTVIASVRSGQVDTRPWITHRATFDNMVEQFPSWLLPETGVIKAVVDWS